jgi:hypothetical protein
VVEAVRSFGARTINHLCSYEGPFGVGYLVGRVDIETQADAAEVTS